jgi:hypothetical protein
MMYSLLFVPKDIRMVAVSLALAYLAIRSMQYAFLLGEKVYEDGIDAKLRPRLKFGVMQYLRHCMRADKATLERNILFFVLSLFALIECVHNNMSHH